MDYQALAEKADRADREAREAYQREVDAARRARRQKEEAAELARQQRASAARDAEEKAKREKAERQKKLAADWKAVSKIVTTRAMKRRTRIRAVESFIRDYPADNPHLETARLYLSKLRAGEELGIDVGDMVRVPAGEFFVGCDRKIPQPHCTNAKPGRKILLDSFLIDRTEVTVADYRRCIRSGKCAQSTAMTGTDCNFRKSGRDDHPINCVDWVGAAAYCRAQGKRLPTDDEWEKAARGTDGRVYPWGNKRDPRLANLVGELDGYDKTAPVGSFPLGASPYGVLDMVGNVSEWTADWFYRGRNRSLRGGAAYGSPIIANVLYRNNTQPANWSAHIGFRCAK